MSGNLWAEVKCVTGAEYALRGLTQPIGNAEYRLQLPDDFAKDLPSIEQIEAELQGDD